MILKWFKNDPRGSGAGILKTAQNYQHRLDRVDDADHVLRLVLELVQTHPYFDDPSWIIAHPVQHPILLRPLIITHPLVCVFPVISRVFQ